MATMSIYISAAGTPLSDGGTSLVGHMYFTLTDANGVTYSYGFAPAMHGVAFGPGAVYTNDSTHYLQYAHKRDFDIPGSAFDKVLAWAELNKISGGYGDYAGIGNNCITFTYDAMRSAGIGPNMSGVAYGDPWSTWNGDNVDHLFYQYMRRAEFNRELRLSNHGLRESTENESNGITQIDYNILGDVNTHYLTARNHLPRKDPLVLDLDGGGISTTPIDPNAPRLFDTDGDGVRTATGWVGAGEGIVVRDLNGNGTIDSGRELFGDATVLTQGPSAGQTAAHGFAALADLDSNADGQFDATDAAFASVRLWLDANQDGISQPAELHTLAEKGVARIEVAASVHNVDLGGGNVQTYSASFTRTSGQQGSAGTAPLAGSLLLAGNSFYRQFSDDPATTPEAAALPAMHGSGWVRDLHPALSLGNAASGGPTRLRALTVIDCRRHRRKPRNGDACPRRSRKRQEYL